MKVMIEYQWATKEGLRNLLCELVSWESRTLTDGEREFPEKVASKLRQLTYFQENPSHLGLYDADLGRRFVSALYKHPEAHETIVLISHFDTVFTEEYGDLKDFAFQPEKLTQMLYSQIDNLPADAKEDLLSGEYLFGRGTMDMKMGLAMHMGLMEKASIEKWPINLVLLSVPDEEVNSAGMRAAVVKLVNMKKEYGLQYKLFLNGEPVFSQQPGDNNYYVYTGSIGKIMPSVLFYGRETHVGEPLAGMTAPYIASFMTQKMEWNVKFQETVLGEKTPLPVTLQQKDIKMEYSTQTPFRTTALYNVFLMERNAAEIMDIFEEIAMDAAKECSDVYLKTCTTQNIRPVGQVQVLRYEQLLGHAVTKLGKVFVESVKAETFANKEWDDREKCFRIANKLMIECQELAPAMILLFAPPYYPAVNSSNCDFIKDCVDYMVEQGEKRFELPVKQIHYFNGISDLSYVNYKDNGRGWESFVANTPVWGEGYSIPFEDMKELQAPVLNIGPFGKDAHKRTERLNTKSAFEEVPALVEGLIKMISSKNNQIHTNP
jgi:arginine utilization protein RocB